MQRLISCESTVWLCCSADLEQVWLTLTGLLHGQLADWPGARLGWPHRAQFVCVPCGLLFQQASPAVWSRQREQQVQRPWGMQGWMFEKSKEASMAKSSMRGEGWQEMRSVKQGSGTEYHEHLVDHCQDFAFYFYYH